jgi:hypothetical protein
MSQTIATYFIGSIARRLLTQTQRASVVGVARQGVFLSLLSNWVLFISHEPFRGPLILNVATESFPLQDIHTGLPVTVEDGNLYFASQNLIIHAGQATTWSVPPLPAISAATLAERIARLEAVWGAIYQSKSIDLPLPLFEVGSPLITQLEQLIGLGSGLTPAGDDLALGFLLAVNRWGTLISPDLAVEPLNQAMRQTARRKTTNLSASLIECAAEGQADERLILALDGIVTGNLAIEACVSCLSGWGNTSGLHALLGMRLAMGGFAGTIGGIPLWRKCS